MKRLLIHLLILLMFPLTSQANIRVIGNGGGDAEMRALSLFSQLSRVLFICRKDQNICGLDDFEREHLKKIAQVLSSKENLKLQFHSLGEDFVFDQRENTLSVNESRLPSTNGSVMAFLFRGLESALFGEVSETAKRITRKIFERHEWSFQSTPFSEGRLISLQTDSWAFLLAESESGGIEELNPRIMSKIKCAPISAELIQVSSLSRESFGFSARVVWQCADETSQATLYGSYQQKEWNLRLFGISALWSPKNVPDRRNCSRNLEAPHKTF